MIFLSIVFYSLYSCLSFENRIPREWQVTYSRGESPFQRGNGTHRHYIPVEFQQPGEFERYGCSQLIPVADAEVPESNPVCAVILSGGIKNVSSQTGNISFPEISFAGLYERAGPFC